jgi:hypothetical protein
MGVFFPFLEVFKMTKSAFSIPNIVRRFLSKHRARIKIWLEEADDWTKENRRNDQNDEQADGQRSFPHFRSLGACVIANGFRFGSKGCKESV